MNANKKIITLKEFKELHSKRQSKTLTPFERYKIMCTLKSPIEVLILIHIYTKFLHFDMKEFHQRKFDIQVGTSNYSENTITNNLNSLEKKGYFTQEFKQVKGKNYNRIHFNINIQKLNELLTTGDELKPENFSRLIETLRRQNEVVKSNPYNKPKAKTLKSIEEVNNNLSDNSIATTYNPTEDSDSDSKTHKTIGFKDDSDDELVGISFEDFEDDKEVVNPIDKPNDDILDSKTDIKTIEPAVKSEILSNEDTPIIPAVEPETLPNEPDKLIDDDIPTEEIIELKNQPDEVIEESTNSKKEDKNNNQLTENFMKEEFREEDFNERTKLFLKYKEIEGIKPVIEDTRLSFQTINYLYSDNYQEGIDKNLDNKKATLDILYDIRIKPLINK